MERQMMIEIIPVISEEQIDQVRKLVREFVRWHKERHREDIELIETYFEPGNFEKELVSLPGKYAPPAGQLLLGLYDQQAAGCVALRQIDEQTCEMKRMFVDTRLHGKGIGRELAKAVIGEARKIGYKKMLLDTSIRQVEALTLYQSMGFVRIGPYYEVADRLRNWLVFMELEL
jgi:GNAT superfamily N-acetyltransferase